MEFLTKIKEFLKLDSLEEQLQRYERISKAIQDYNLKLSDIIKEHGTLKSNFNTQLRKSNGDGKYIQQRYNNHFSSYIEKVKQVKDNLGYLENEKTKLLKSSIRLEDEINKSILQGCMPENELHESIVILATGFEKGIVSGETLEEAKRNFSQLKRTEREITINGQSFMLLVYEDIEKATKADDIVKQQGNELEENKKTKEKDLANTKMTHCDAKSCEHYKDASGTTNCILKGVTVSATGDCNQYEPKPKEDDSNSEEVNKGEKAVKEAMKHKDVLGAGAKKRKKLSSKDKVSAVMKEYKQGTLHSGGGEKVTDRKQAIAIALSEAGMSKAEEFETALQITDTY